MCPSYSVFSCVCLSVLQPLSVCLFVNAGAEDKVGPLQRCAGCGPAAGREWRRHLAPSISVSVPKEEPCNSDEEYYEHPLFSSEWTGSSTHPSATVKSTEVLLGHDEGEMSIVPFGSSSPLLTFTCHPFHSFMSLTLLPSGERNLVVFSPQMEVMPLQESLLSR